HVPLIPFFQFPWMFLIITTFMIPIFVIAFEKIKPQKFIALIIIALALITTGSNFHPHDYLGREDSYYLNRYIPVPYVSAEYSMLQEEYLRLPNGTIIRPDKNYPRIFPQTNLITQMTEINSLTTLINTKSNEKFTINYNKYYFPGWYATIDNQKVKISAGLPFGQIQFDIPSGNHEIKIGFSETREKLFFDIISALSFVLAVLFCFKSGLFGTRRTIK
ncbi:MAG: hypothetical protein Q7R95_08665, partial [bacterium]|nr:hypothetical protein [bacterium]